MGYPLPWAFSILVGYLLLWTLSGLYLCWNTPRQGGLTCLVVILHYWWVNRLAECIWGAELYCSKFKRVWISCWMAWRKSTFWIVEASFTLSRDGCSVGGVPRRRALTVELVLHCWLVGKLNACGVAEFWARKAQTREFLVELLEDRWSES